MFTFAKEVQLVLVNLCLDALLWIKRVFGWARHCEFLNSEAIAIDSYEIHNQIEIKIKDILYIRTVLNYLMNQMINPSI